MSLPLSLPALASIPYPNIPSVELGPLTLHPFGFLVGVAIIVGTVLADRRAKVLGLDRRVISEASLWAVLVGFAVAHWYSIIFYFPERVVEEPLVLLKFWDGISSFGGFLGGTFGLIYYLRRNKLPFWPYADAIIYGFTFAWVFGRAGCTVAFDHPGVITDFALAMPYPAGRGFAPGIRHNLGFYELLWAVLMAAVFFWQRNKPHWAGWYLTVFVLAYMPIRFAWDFLRVADKTYLGLTPGQFAAIALIVVGIWMFRFRRGRAEVLIPDGRVHIYADGTPAVEPEPAAVAPPKKKAKGGGKRGRRR